MSKSSSHLCFLFVQGHNLEVIVGHRNTPMIGILISFLSVFLCVYVSMQVYTHISAEVCEVQRLTLVSFLRRCPPYLFTSCV